MPSPMIIPGVQVTALFEPEPVLPGAIGILGMVGVVDRGPLTPTAVGNMAELTEVFGAATRFTIPEARAAFMNGVSEVVVARVQTSAAKAQRTLKDDDGEDVVVLRARAEGSWGNQLGARVTQVKTAIGTVKYVNIDISLSGTVVESFTGLVMDEESPNYLFDRINQGSRLVIAFDPGFAIGPPKVVMPPAPTPFAIAAGTAFANFPFGGNPTPAVTATASQPGRAGNRIVISVRPDGAGVAIKVGLDGEDPKEYTGLTTPTLIQGLVDPLVTFTANALPDPTPTGGVRLKGGRDAGPALLLPGNTTSTEPIVELMPADPALSDVLVTITGNLTTVDITVSRPGEELEKLTGLVMDPDDPRYLIDVLNQSKTLRARDLAERSKASTLPKNLTAPQALIGGTAPTPEDYEKALGRLEQIEEVDLVIASTATQLDNADASKVQQAVVAHCTNMAGKARNRIGISSVFADENENLPAIADLADDLRSNHFILTAPAGTEGAMAGLLGRLDYFRSPTFKPIASIDAPLVPYSDTQLSKLITANVTVIAPRSGFGKIPLKGLTTGGRQINVQRTADVGVRRVNEIAKTFIGLLNNAGTRNALKQMVVGMFLQMERDGAIVPSVDGTRPAFTVDVFSSPADFATGIVRIDVAMLPVHAIDYVYATVLVQN